ncbi:hypothetical protein DID88_007513 [Monilinia fructigena]|uniref:alpha-1,2-Mannosidase n=1 Tax=Monilinia fructigena TaxID=38457 RepID=A0A395J2L8_9HELO|nr:hypothetical protein DID88_007513 [Monilinia fructigena]
MDPFGGWAASLVDTLDTLWIMGGFLSAYELSGKKYPVLLRKAAEMGEMLYKAFDTPNHLPILRWYYHVVASGAKQEAEDNVLVSEIGSLTLEFTRLSQITGDPRYYDAVQRIMNIQTILRTIGLSQLVAWPIHYMSTCRSNISYLEALLSNIREYKDIEGNETVHEKIQQHRLIPGVTKFERRSLYPQPEAIESVFILYRITGDTKLQERAWSMFNNIIKHTITDIAHAALDDCTVSENPPKADRMESFWMAETLKYFYLIFADPDLISLDEYVLNTEAHPLKRPT